MREETRTKRRKGANEGPELEGEGEGGRPRPKRKKVMMVTQDQPGERR